MNGLAEWFDGPGENRAIRKLSDPSGLVCEQLDLEAGFAAAETQRVGEGGTPL
jgi:hypothetical protein